MLRRVLVPHKIALAGSGAFLAYHLYKTKSFPVMAQGKEHHTGSGFKNPWPSAAANGMWETFQMLREIKLGKTEKEIQPHHKPGQVPLNQTLLRQPETAGNNTILTTWLGHACVLVQLNGYNVLFDPVFSDRCSPLSFAGPKRFTDPPCQIEDLPQVDCIVISHNHYDHMDSQSIKKLAELHPNAKFYVPLGNKAWFEIDQSRVVELDWWNASELTIQNAQGHLKLTCTPCQHFSGRGLFDRNKTLWASWCVESIVEGESKGKVFFGGDTGYRAVAATVPPEQRFDEAYLDTLPHCPVFKEIGDKIGPFDVSLIPIGAYSPRWFMSTVHCSPEDAVRVHEDVKSKKSIGIHWGTWVLTDEPVDEPPKRLKASLERRGHQAEDFVVLKLGETLVADAS